jgi:predicted aminopeptidase
LYVKGDSAFNEAYATVVEEEGVRRWLAQYGDLQQRDEHALSQRRRREFLHLLADIRGQLSRLYATDLERAGLLHKKAAIFRRLQANYIELKRDWNGYSAYDRWVNRPLNNAHLASIDTYHALVPAFRLILHSHGGDMAAFHASCARLAEAPKAERKQHMDALLLEAGVD